MKMDIFVTYRWVFVFCIPAVYGNGAFGHQDQPAVRDIINALKSEENEIVSGAQALISKMDEKSKEAMIVPLIEAMKVDDEQVRANVGHALAKVGPKAVPLLMKSLTRKDPRVREGSAFALEVLALNADLKIAVPALLRALQDSSPKVRASVVGALGSIGNKAAISPLIKVVTTDHDRQVRVNAINALRSMACPAKDLIPVLIQILKKEKADGLVAFDLLLTARSTLVFYGSESVPALLEIFQNPNFERCIRLDALQLVSEIGPAVLAYPPTMPVLRKLLKDCDVDFRIAAVGVIGKCAAKGNNVTSELSEALKDKSPLVRMEAAEALYQITQTAKSASVFTNSLIQSLKLDDNEAELAGSILQIRAESLPIALRTIKVMKDKSDQRRYVALNRLESLGPKAKAAIPILISTLHDRDQAIRSAAVRSLVSIGDDALPGLREALQDSDLLVKQAAKNAIEAIETTRGKRMNCNIQR